MDVTMVYQLTVHYKLSFSLLETRWETIECSSSKKNETFCFRVIELSMGMNNEEKVKPNFKLKFQCDSSSFSWSQV